MLSRVAIRRAAFNRAGASVPGARQAPLNSSISEIKASYGGVIRMVSILIDPNGSRIRPE
jgi:hypothetical protein